MSAPTVFLADDHAMLLEAFAKLLEDTYQVVGTAEDGRQLVARASACRPDVIVLDVGMPNLNGIDAARQLRKLLPQTRFVFLTMNDDPDVAAQALKDGASGYLLKSSAASELLAAIDSALKGRVYVSPLVTREILTSVRTGEPAKTKLTPRQREILQLIAEGRSMKEIASELGITPRTVAYHKYAMMDALGIQTTAELVRHAVDQGLTPP
ncbi:MAG: response regulator transcription factor [Candidatus Eisenbacteria bacterium]|uniref:Response regulator transcription factor n=1 Tax=Eiseniibacteriota bacterium TaxID=2212470 RepID=A0A956M2M4_UNCEI|nr:response regulator transcription factor [Candidatus Eisenbacteria bacterium]